MVKHNTHDTVGSRINQGETQSAALPCKIGPDTPHELCGQQLSAFGGITALVKMLDILDFRNMFESHYKSPTRKTKLGCFKMMYGLLMLLFIGFNRVGHVLYVRRDPALCGVLGVTILPAVSTFWRYVSSLGLNQSRSLLELGAALRCRVWQICGLNLKSVRIDIDTTVATVYGDIDGSRKGHNTKHRGKKGLRPVLCFIAQTREYLCGTMRRGTTMANREVARLIRSFDRYLPGCVKHILVSADGEFIGEEAIQACEEKGYQFIFANKVCTPDFPETGWYRWGKHEYNECMHQPVGWNAARRFVAMRIAVPPKKNEDRQLTFFGPEYKYRVFSTNLKKRPHKAIQCYDKRADCENLIGESQREGICAIPSKKFHRNHAYFQIVMLAYNLWRWLKMVAQESAGESNPGDDGPSTYSDMSIRTIRSARLILLYLPMKITSHSNKSRVFYSRHDDRAPGLRRLLDYMDVRRKEKIIFTYRTRSEAFKDTG